MNTIKQAIEIIEAEGFKVKEIIDEGISLFLITIADNVFAGWLALNSDRLGIAEDDPIAGKGVDLRKIPKNSRNMLELSYMLDKENPNGDCIKDEIGLFEFARKCQLKYFW